MAIRSNRCDRPMQKGGGVALYLMKDILKNTNPKLISQGSSTCLEHLAMSFSINNKSIAIAVGYMNKTGIPLDDLENLLQDDVLKSILAVKSNSIGADNLSLKFLKMCHLPAILPIVTHLFNAQF